MPNNYSKENLIKILQQYKDTKNMKHLNDALKVIGRGPDPRREEIATDFSDRKDYDLLHLIEKDIIEKRMNARSNPAIPRLIGACAQIRKNQGYPSNIPTSKVDFKPQEASCSLQ